MKIDAKLGISLVLAIALVVSILGMLGVFNQNDILLSAEIENEKPLISVYIVGEIEKPGVYKIKYGGILKDLIELAGGLSNNADANYINMAYPFYENAMVSIKPKSAFVSSESEGFLVYDEEASALMVDINTADVENLIQIPGIGEKTAEAIINYRNSNGNFTSIEEIMNVQGIKESKFSSISDFIYVSCVSE